MRAARHVRKVPDAQMLATLRSPIDAVLAHVMDEVLSRTITYQILYSSKLPPR